MPHARKFCAALIAADEEKAKEWAKGWQYAGCRMTILSASDLIGRPNARNGSRRCGHCHRLSRDESSNLIGTIKIAILSARSIARLLHLVLWPWPEVAAEPPRWLIRS
jgi:hypothetical protein